jgi:hypothetical protein
MQRKRLVLSLILLIAAYLAGLLPPYMKARRLDAQMSASATQLQSCRYGEQLSRLRDEAALMYVGVTQKNYGIAAEHATQLFNQAQQMSSTTQNAAVTRALQEILASRDEITADLSKGDAGVLGPAQSVLLKINDVRP